jgi:hypothetical protein
LTNTLRTSISLLEAELRRPEDLRCCPRALDFVAELLVPPRLAEPCFTLIISLVLYSVTPKLVPG